MYLLIILKHQHRPSEIYSETLEMFSIFCDIFFFIYCLLLNIENLNISNGLRCYDSAERATNGYNNSNMLQLIL